MSWLDEVYERDAERWARRRGEAKAPEEKSSEAVVLLRIIVVLLLVAGVFFVVDKGTSSYDDTIQCYAVGEC